MDRLQRSLLREETAQIPDLLADLIPVAIIAEMIIIGVTKGNLMRMTVARRGTHTESTMVLPLDLHQEDLTITGPEEERGLRLVTEGEPPPDQERMTIEEVLMIEDTLEKGVSWRLTPRATLVVGQLTTTGRVPTPDQGRHLEEGRQPERRPEDRLQGIEMTRRDTPGSPDHKVDTLSHHRGWMTEQAWTEQDL